MKINNSTRLRRIFVRLQGTSAGAYQGSRICAGGCNAVDGQKKQQDVELFIAEALSRDGGVNGTIRP